MDMTIEDKARLVCGSGPFGIGNQPENGIPEILMQDGGTGINFEQLFDELYRDEGKGYTPEEFDNVSRKFFREGELTGRELELRSAIYARLKDRCGAIEAAPGCYPPGILLGATWNPDIVEECGRALGLEAKVYGIDVLLGTPNVNLLREPRNGRFFEGYSEDPVLCAEMAPRMCEGVESQGTASNVKHFAANNQEINRVGIDETISEGALEELYFPAFKACSRVCSTVMVAYNSINGVKCTENRWLIRDKLRGQWGFDGVVMTDWSACTGPAGDCIEAGVDVIMPGPWPHEDIEAAVRDSRLSASHLDEAAARLTRLIRRHSGVRFSEAITNQQYMEMGDMAAYSAACEGIVMLINRDGLFPVSEGQGLVIMGGDGSMSDYGGGSAQVFTPRTTNFARELADRHGIRVSFDDYDRFRNGDTAVVVEKVQAREGTDRADIKLTAGTRELLKQLTDNRGSGKICLILNTSGPVELGEFENSIDALFAVFYPGMMGGRALSDIMAGTVNPSGALPVTFPVKYEDTPGYLSYPDSFHCNYGEGIFAGYRGYQKRRTEPLFPFGYGMSYTSFDIAGACAGLSGNEIRVGFKVKNTGRREGKATVQVYVHKVFTAKNRPVRELAAFGKYSIAAGDAKNCELVFDIHRLEYFDEDYGKFLLEQGEYAVELGLSCEDIRAVSTIYVENCSPELACGPRWTCGQINEVPELVQALAKDVECAGKSFQPFISCLRYSPFDRVTKAFPDCADFPDFMALCSRYRSR